MYQKTRFNNQNEVQTSKQHNAGKLKLAAERQQG